MSDILGQAIDDYYQEKRSHKLWVHDEIGPNLEMPVKTYFRTEAEMPELEKKALALCRGKILDIGAGAGSHALILQERGLDVTALEISPKAAAVISKRGVKNVIQTDIFKFKKEQFDTLLLMMNGIGLSASPEGLKRFLQHAQSLLKPGAQLIFDSSDVSYLYEDEPFPMSYYYGEIKCRYEYRKKFSDWITWLYIDQEYLKDIAHKCGFSTKVIFEDDHDQYLVQLNRIES